MARDFCARLLEYNGRRLSSGDLLYLKSQSDTGTFPYFLLSFQSSLMDERGRKIQFIIGFEFNHCSSVAFNSDFLSVITDLDPVVGSFSKILAKFVEKRTLPEHQITYDFDKNILASPLSETIHVDSLNKTDKKIHRQNEALKIGHFMDQCITFPVKLGNFDFNKCGAEYNPNYADIQQDEIDKVNAFHAEILPTGLSAVWKDGYFATKEAKSKSLSLEKNSPIVKKHAFEGDERGEMSDEDRAWALHNENECKRFGSLNPNLKTKAVIIASGIKPQKLPSKTREEPEEVLDSRLAKSFEDNSSASRKPKGVLFGFGKKRKGD